MQLTRLNKLLEKIEREEDVNLHQLTKEIEKLNLKHPLQANDILGHKVKGDFYNITYFNPELWHELQSLTKGAGKDRNSAAHQNLSHNHKIDGSFILIRHVNEHPQVVTIAADGGYINPITQSKRAVIVENRQLFLFADKFLSFLEKHTDVPSDQPLDVLFGMGNELANSLHARFLNSYEHLYLCLDMDLGGLKTANSVFNLLPEQSISFVQPFDIAQRLEKVVCIKDQRYLQEIGEFRIKAHPSLEPYAQLIREMGRTIEQESYLDHE